jgi:RNA polymerase sigma-70 factor (ECF subfamily)
MTEDSRDDRALLAAARAGDEAAMQALWLRHRDWACQVARRYTRQEDAARDVVQEVFRDFFRALETLTPDTEPRAWLWPRLRNRGVDWHRREHRYVALPADHDVPAGADPDTADQRLHDLIADLPDDQRAVVVLRFLDGLRIPEIAARLHIPEGTVKSRLHHALRQLRESLK